MEKEIEKGNDSGPGGRPSDKGSWERQVTEASGGFEFFGVGGVVGVMDDEFGD